MGKRKKKGSRERKADRQGQAFEVGPPTLTFEGRQFQLAQKVGLMPLMAFAHLAKDGVDANDMAGLAATYALLRSVIADEAWPAFEDHASLVRADGDDLMAVVTQAIEIISARPTVRPSDSSVGPVIVSEHSAVDSSSAVIHRLEAEGRPSIALMVRQREQASRDSA